PSPLSRRWQSVSLGCAMAEFQQVYDEICSEHGLVSSVDLSLGRLLAGELCADKPNVDVVLRLRAALPAKTALDDGGTLDLTKLSDEEFHALHDIVSKSEAAKAPGNPVMAQMAASAKEMAERCTRAFDDNARLRLQNDAMHQRISELTREV